MALSRFHRLIQVQIRRLRRHTNNIWYTPLISLLSLLDNFIIIIPNDGILISSTMLVPKKWHIFAVCMAMGSTLGAVLLAYFVKMEGLPLILNYYPGIDNNQIWTWSEIFLEKYGLLFVFVVGLSPFMQQPAIILASLANITLFKLSIVIFLGRVIKFLVMSYVAASAPKYLSSLWGIRKELKMVEVDEIKKGKPF